MRFAREMCLRHMKYADAYEDLFHFILRPKGAIFHNDPGRYFTFDVSRIFHFSLKSPPIFESDKHMRETRRFGEKRLR